MTTLDELRSGDAQILLLATGACLGEGVDLAAFDTLFLASPISGRSRVVQYVGRVTRPLPDKTGVDAVRLWDRLPIRPCAPKNACSSRSTPMRS